jgi:hypothetical protein
MPVQQPPIERTPAPVGSASGVRHDDMRVQQRVARARRSMLEPCRHEPVTTVRDHATGTTPDPARLALQVLQGLLYRGGVCRSELACDRAVSDREQHADRLWGTERQVESGDRTGRQRLAQQVT